jgi:hypothetical protein
VHAQYKKASFLSKSGRTYELGANARLLTGGGTVPGFYYSYGRDKGKRIFHWFDLEFLLPTKFNYNTTDRDHPETVVNVTGKSKLGLAYRYNLAYYLTNVENSESKLKPFVTGGVNFLLLGGSAKTSEQTPPNVYPSKIVSYNAFNCGANAGLGAIYSFSEKIGIKLTAGYNWQGALSDEIGSGYEVYNVFGNHAYVGLGIRFRNGW